MSDGALGGWGRKEKRFEGALIERVGQRPRQVGGLSSIDIVGDGGTLTRGSGRSGDR
jgi:hypothetical protein